MRRLTAIAFLLGLLGLSAAAGEQPTAFVGGTLIGGAGLAPIPNAGLLVRGDRILAAGPVADLPVPADAVVVDTTGRWIIPGLIDAHIFFQSGGLYTRPDIIDLRAVRPYAAEVRAIRASLPETLARYLASGITSVVDLGGPLWNFEVRAVAQTTRTAPRVAVAGPLLATYAPPQLAGPAGPPMVSVGTPAQATAEATPSHARPDQRSGSSIPAGTSPPSSPGSAAIATSHAAGVRVVVHATQARVARAAIDPAPTSWRTASTKAQSTTACSRP